jgi:tetratricopeptide (TPR) repeat protein
LKDQQGANRLRAVARAADPDPDRNRVREALEGRGQQLIEELAVSDRVEDLPPTTVVLLAHALPRTGPAESTLPVLGASAVGLASSPFGQGPALAAAALFTQPTWASGEAVLRRAHRQHPDDLWINHALAFYLHYGMAPRPEEAIRFYTAALALRPRSPGVWLNLGRAFSDAGKLPEAAEAYRQAIHLNGTYAQAHNNLGAVLLESAQIDEAIAELRKAIRLKKDYPMGHYNLANALQAKGCLDEAIAEYCEAIRNQKNYIDAHNNLGNALKARGRLDEAIAQYQQAIRLKKDYPLAHSNLGLALSDKGEEDEAIAEFREAIRLKQDLGEAHYGLALAMHRKRQLDNAITEYREAIRLRAIYLPEAYYGLGTALNDKGQLDEANAQFQEAIRLKPDYAEAHCNLGCGLFWQGRFTEAATALRRGDELGSRQPGWHSPSAWWLRRAERFIQLDAQLPKVLAGQALPKDTSEQIQLAECASYKGLKAAAASLYARAFAAEPGLAESFATGHRYNAACAGALAGCGQGKDAGSLDETERARLRRQALNWLRADLAAWRQQREGDPNKAGPTVLALMQRWQQDANFAGVRDAEALASLPEAERFEWQKLWADVRALRQRAVERK